MKLMIKICFGCVIFIALSSAQSIPLYRFTIDRIDRPESLLGQFLIKKDVSHGIITEDDIHNFKFVSGSLQNFDYNFWNYFGQSLQFQALLQADGSVVPGVDSELYLNSYPPYELANGIIDIDIDFGFADGDGLTDRGAAVCHSSDEADLRCDGTQEDSVAYLTFSFTTIRNVPEAGTLTMLGLGLLGIGVTARRKRNKRQGNLTI